MNNRWSERQTITWPVAINYGPLGIVKGTAKDISVNGMFIDTSPVTLFDDEMVSISFAHPYDEHAGYVDIVGDIRHTSDNGAGIKFINYCLTLSETRQS
jgi:hypothetical protein